MFLKNNMEKHSISTTIIFHIQNWDYDFTEIWHAKIQLILGQSHSTKFSQNSQISQKLDNKKNMKNPIPNVEPEIFLYWLNFFLKKAQKWAMGYWRDSPIVT